MKIWYKIVNVPSNAESFLIGMNNGWGRVQQIDFLPMHERLALDGIGPSGVIGVTGYDMYRTTIKGGIHEYAAFTNNASYDIDFQTAIATLVKR